MIAHFPSLGGERQDLSEGQPEHSGLGAAFRPERE